MPVGDNKVWLRDMVREVKTFERLHHPNIVEYKHSWLELSRRSEFCPFVPCLAANAAPIITLTSLLFSFQ